MYSANLIGKQMDTEFGLYLPEYSIPAPEVQTNYKEIPFRDGAIDKTSPDGVVHYKDREWDLTFKKTGATVSASDLAALAMSVMNAIHGKAGEIIFDDDPNYKWVGRVFVTSVNCENNGLLIVNIHMITHPYKYSLADIVVVDEIQTTSDEYEGSIVSLTGGIGKSITELLVSFSPIQDLHGYSSPWIGTDYDQQPYNFRAVSSSSVSPLGNSEMGNIVGGTVAWNQLVVEGKTLSQNFSVRNGTLTVGTDYATYTASSASTLVAVVTTTQTPKVLNSKFIVNFDIYPATSKNVRMWLVDYSANTSILRSVTAAKWNNVSGVLNVNSANNLREIQLQLNCTEVGEEDKLKNVSVYNLTQMFGSTIADYIYSLEQANSGAGVAWFRKLFPKDYYAYDAGSLLSVKTTAHKEYGFNAYDNSTGKAKVVGGQVYQITGTYTALSLDGSSITPDASGYFTPSASGEITVTGGNATDTCIHLKWDGERDGEYEPYEVNTYALDDVELRGIPKLDASNNLYYDGDSYEADGTVERNFGTLTFNGSESWRVHGSIASWFFIDRAVQNANTNNSEIGFAITNEYAQKYYSAVAVLENGQFALGTPDNIITRLVVKDTRFTTIEQFKAHLASNPLTIVYELATPTTESADPYTSPQSVSPYGTEEYVDAGVAAGTRDVAIPVGHETTFANICPISGRTGLNVYVGPTQDVADATTYAVDWTTEAGTVYGGTLDVVMGVLTVDRAMVDMGTLNWSATGDRFTVSQKLVPNPVSKAAWDTSNPIAICSMYKYGNIGNGNGVDKAIGFYSGYLYARDTAYSTAADFKSAMSGVQLCYELATPLTYQLTPQEVALLVGTNNIWSTGDSVSVTLSTMDKVTLVNHGKPMNPKINVVSEGSISLLFEIDGTRYTAALSAGEYILPDLVLFDGSTDVYEAGEGTITYTYPEVSL